MMRLGSKVGPVRDATPTRFHRGEVDARSDLERGRSASSRSWLPYNSHSSWSHTLLVPWEVMTAPQAPGDGACHPGRLMAPGPDPTFGAVLTVVPQAGCLPTAFRACGPSSCQHYSGHAKLRGSDAWSSSRSRRPSRSPPRTGR